MLRHYLTNADKVISNQNYFSRYFCYTYTIAAANHNCCSIRSEPHHLVYVNGIRLQDLPQLVVDGECCAVRDGLQSVEHSPHLENDICKLFESRTDLKAGIRLFRIFPEFRIFQGSYILLEMNRSQSQLSVEL